MMFGAVVLQKRLFISIALLSLMAAPQVALAEDACYECHGEEDFGRDDGPAGGLFVDAKKFSKSVHADVGCSDCHQDATLVDDEHKPELAPVSCGECHEEVAEKFGASLHGKALARGDKDAPTCASCHGKHDILAAHDPAARTYKINVPGVCSSCHSEGKGLSDRHEIGQKRVIETYSMSIHGEGVFKRGLTVAAVCNDCHGDHDVLPHEDPESSIHHDRVAQTCMRCHGEIERVHVKVIEQKLWEESPGQIPACIDCHASHKLRKVQYKFKFGDDECLACHSDEKLKGTIDGKPHSVFTERSDLYSSAHKKLTCVMCHSNVTRESERPCEHAGKVDCASCHAEAVAQHEKGIHGKLAAQGSEHAPDCRFCHGTHTIKTLADRDSPVNVRNIPELCARCHREGEQAASIYTGTQHDIIANYGMSIHGKGLIESGLIVTAVCTDCHTAHMPLPKDDPESSVHHDNIGKTCAQCHEGVLETFEQSVHSPKYNDTDKPLPSCAECHSSHRIGRVDEANFRTVILDRCGRCHEELTHAYFDTYHGKVSLLGAEKTAKCSDCHSAHLILPIDNPRSTLSRDNIVATCEKCHEGSHRQFAGYLTHATHKDPDKYPVLYYAFWFMTLLLTGTLAAFSLHTLLWLPRSLREMLKRRAHPHDPNEKYVRRFKAFHRLTHLLVIVSFFLLAITGMMLKFSYAPWAQTLSRFLGGFETAGSIHRFGAILTFIYFAMHLYHLAVEKRERKVSWFRFVLDKEGTLPNFRDVKEFFQTLKWFFGRGPRPHYGRFTYWEKFDYFAVFWGVAIIGFSGLMLWFPEFFTLFMPGWVINVATIVHSDEALLASGFIFTIHFFNTHFRPERFPMDPVIFTGSISLSEFKLERPREYEQAVADGTLEEMFVPAPSENFLLGARIFGLSMLTIGLTLIGLIVYAMIMLYQ
jgi:cytochrome b subunit of formate dehydrogenase